MVFCDLFSQKYGFPLSFVIVIIHWKMKDLSFFIIVPVLGTVCGKYGMFHRKKKGSIRSQPSADPLCKGRKVFYVMKSQGTEDNIERMVWKFQIFHSCSLISDLFMAVDLFCLTEHFFRKVYTKYLCGAFLYPVSTVPPIAAAQIQNFFICKIRHHFLEFLPLSGALKTVFRPVHFTVFLKKHRIIIFVFLHQFVPLPALNSSH